ncbi:MAG TPA: class I SAM-dependent methyltransferase [Methanomicrobiales archaeon]|nr:class I SAM-dependent methyltransferase [Methanomicrobiales archaeon]
MVSRRNRVNALREAFDTIASRYDEHRRWIIPDFRGFYAAAVAAATSRREDPAILDIGAGTGLLPGFLLEVYPAASLTLMDLSGEMLAVARRRFAGRDATRFIVADYREADLGGPFDLICSALSIHHLGREEKRELYRRIFAALGRDGTFVNADEFKGETAREHRENLGRWDEFLLGGPLGEAGAREIMERRDRLDRMEKLSVQLGWLEEIGFTGVEVPYRNGTFAVIAGKRPS